MPHAESRLPNVVSPRGEMRSKCEASSRYAENPYDNDGENQEPAHNSQQAREQKCDQLALHFIVLALQQEAAEGTAAKGAHGAHHHHEADSEANMFHFVGGRDSGNTGRAERHEAAGEEAVQDSEGDHGGKSPHYGPAKNRCACKKCHDAENVEAVER